MGSSRRHAESEGRMKALQYLRDTIDELYDSEKERHPMFSEGYNHALSHITEFLDGDAFKRSLEEDGL